MNRTFALSQNCSAVTAACMALRKTVFDEVGGFDENLPNNFNDVDFCLRLREANLRVVYEPRAIVDHFEFGSAINVEWAKALMRKNRVRLVQKHSTALQHHPAHSEGN